MKIDNDANADAFDNALKDNIKDTPDKYEVRVKHGEDVIASMQQVPEPIRSFLLEVIDVATRHKVPLVTVYAGSETMFTGLTLGTESRLANMMMELSKELSPSLRDLVSEYYRTKRGYEFLEQLLGSALEPASPNEVN